MGLTDICDRLSISELISYFSTKSVILKKIVFFEIMGLVNADDKIEDAEQLVISEINEKFELRDDVIKAITEAANKLQEVYDMVYNVLFE